MSQSSPVDISALGPSEKYIQGRSGIQHKRVLNVYVCVCVCVRVCVCVCARACTMYSTLTYVCQCAHVCM